VAFSSTLRQMPIGKAEVLRQGQDLLILALGASVYPALGGGQGTGKTGFRRHRGQRPVCQNPWMSTLNPEPGSPTQAAS